MYLEELLILIGLPLIAALVFIHVWMVEPALKRHGFDPRGVDDWLVHRDWRLYFRDCNGAGWIYCTLWGGYILAVAIVALQFAQFFLFPGVKLWG